MTIETLARKLDFFLRGIARAKAKNAEYRKEFGCDSLFYTSILRERQNACYLTVKWFLV